MHRVIIFRRIRPLSNKFLPIVVLYTRILLSRSIDCVVSAPKQRPDSPSWCILFHHCYACNLHRSNLSRTNKASDPNIHCANTLLSLWNALQALLTCIPESHDHCPVSFVTDCFNFRPERRGKACRNFSLAVQQPVLWLQEDLAL